MGIAGGAVITPIRGTVSKYFGIESGFIVLLLCVLYILLLGHKFAIRDK